MIKFVLAGLWICLATIGSMYFAFTAAAPAPEVEEPAYFGGLDYVKTDVMSVPVFRDHRIVGYFLTRLVYTIMPEEAKKLSLPVEIMMFDEVYSHLYGNPQTDFTQVDSVDLDAFRGGIREKVNARVGAELIHEVLIEQIDFLSKEDIRDNTVRRRTQAAEVDAARQARH